MCQPRLTLRTLSGHFAASCKVCADRRHRETGGNHSGAPMLSRLPEPRDADLGRRTQSRLERATRFLGARQVAELVRQLGLSTCIAGIAARIEHDFRRWKAFDTSPRVACHSAAGVVELMPVADAARYAFKYVNGHPGNTRHGLPTVMAFGVLADVHTGLPLLLSDLTLATAIRTAAMSAL